MSNITKIPTLRMRNRKPKNNKLNLRKHIAKPSPNIVEIENTSINLLQDTFATINNNTLTSLNQVKAYRTNSLAENAYLSLYQDNHENQNDHESQDDHES